MEATIVGTLGYVTNYKDRSKLQWTKIWPEGGGSKTRDQIFFCGAAELIMDLPQ